ncbi:hypothetical protein HDU76_012617 [Blyttiomyces sp. JEL0837]|nr:hypothetical protein HDU76_012617 [Blyttiomyces sp. JEL0837]
MNHTTTITAITTPPTHQYGRFGHELYSKQFNPSTTLTQTCTFISSNPHSRIGILVGRGTVAIDGVWGISKKKGTDTDKDDENGNDDIDVWIPCDRFGGMFKSVGGDSMDVDDDGIQDKGDRLKESESDGNSGFIPHLWMDFNNLDALSMIPSNSICKIVFDWVT